MKNLLDDPILVAAITVVLLWFSAWMAALARQRMRYELSEDHRRDFNVILSATLTLLGLIIGFTFSMAVNGFEERDSAEGKEAAAIGTAYARADLMPEAEASQVRDTLRRYTSARIRFYATRNRNERQQIDRDTTQLQNKLWAAAVEPAKAEPNPIKALVVAGINDVVRSERETQAAWWDRIPAPAWALMIVIAVFSNLMLGHGARRTRTALFMVLPVVVAISFFLIAELDSPWEGFIRIDPQNLQSLSDNMHTR
ncbi:MAG TPA: hypothetical protein VHT28_13355 [Silvibacterium sp.]|nr:hypothetical protein [Silvibacterium sp.]